MLFTDIFRHTFQLSITNTGMTEKNTVQQNLFNNYCVIHLLHAFHWKIFVIHDIIIYSIWQLIV